MIKRVQRLHVMYCATVYFVGFGYENYVLHIIFVQTTDATTAAAHTATKTSVLLMPIHTFKEKRNRSTYTHAHMAHIDLFVPTDKYLIKIMQFLQHKRKTICGNFIWLNFGGKILKLHKISCFMRRLLKRITNV